jgi:hypothetical protein
MWPACDQPLRHRSPLPRCASQDTTAKRGWHCIAPAYVGARMALLKGKPLNSSFILDRSNHHG